MTLEYLSELSNNLTLRAEMSHMTTFRVPGLLQLLCVRLLLGLQGRRRRGRSDGLNSRQHPDRQ
jgi:hypothetical protein